MSFFGFDSTLPERRDAAAEDVAVYTWGTEDYDGLGSQLQEHGDDENDLTFGAEPIGNDFQFAQQPVQEDRYQQQSYGVKSKLKPTKPASDLFASTEADFFSAPKKSTRFRAKETTDKALPPSGSFLSHSSVTPTRADSFQQNIQEESYKTLAEIEAEARASANVRHAMSHPQQQQQGQALTLEEIEKEMMRNLSQSAPFPDPRQAQPSYSQPPPQPQQPLQTQAPHQSAFPQNNMDWHMQQHYGMAPPVTDRATLVQQRAPIVPVEKTVKPTADMTAVQMLQAQLGNLAMFPPLGTAGPAKGGQGHLKTEEQLDKELEKRIRETEMADMKRQRKANKIASMSRYNDLMTGGDKEFITRIQLSQLVTQDPYISDFYAQVHSAITRARLAAMGGGSAEGPTVLPVGADGRGLGVGVVRTNGTGGRKLKETAMQRMTVQVKRIVENAQKRAVAAPSATLQGALGKNKFRSSATAPRPALSVSASSRTLQTSTANTIANLLKGPLTGPGLDKRQPLTQKQVLLRLEQLYEMILDLEHMRREQPLLPPTEQQKIQFGISDEEAEEKRVKAEEWTKQYEAAVEAMWQALLVQEPLEISDPHPFISLLNVTKGHKLFGRFIRHLSHQQCLTVLILLLACYPQLDVVRNAPLPAFSSGNVLQAPNAGGRKDAEVRTETFLSSVIPVMVQLIGRLELKMVAGMVSLCGERWDVAKVLATRPGVALFTILFSRAEMLKHVASVPLMEGQPAPMVPSQAELDQWTMASANLLRNLVPQLAAVFPSTQAQANAFGPAIQMLGQQAAGEIGARDEKEGMQMDLKDGEVWGLIASFGLQAPPDEQTALVSGLRDKILHTVHSAKKGWVSPARGELRLRNVNLFLNGLGLSADMIE